MTEAALKFHISAAILGEDSQIFKDAWKVRKAVFCDEQKVPEENEKDEDDKRSWHMVCYVEQDGTREPVGTVRLVPPAIPEGKTLRGNYCKIGRLCSTRRKGGVGRLLVEAIVRFAEENRQEVGIRDEEGRKVEGDEVEWNGRFCAHAQLTARGFWERVGFVVDESMGTWMEENMEHCGMWREAMLSAL
ncbi:acetyltransferase [Pyronema omphalodes]|nr:acetyltransferase [Pyronema omphalodes]